MLGYQVGKNHFLQQGEQVNKIDIDTLLRPTLSMRC
jgi:hypothetical protein